MTTIYFLAALVIWIGVCWLVARFMRLNSDQEQDEIDSMRAELKPDVSTWEAIRQIDAEVLKVNDELNQRPRLRAGVRNDKHIGSI